MLDIDCAASGGVCYEGRCLAALCRPETVSCRDQERVRCNANGQSFSVLELCPNNTRCFQGECEPLLCVPDQVTCQNNTRVICNPQGTGQEIRPCLGAQVCFDGACIDPVCEGDEARCLDDLTLGRCDGGGLRPEPCAAGARCVDDACVPHKAVTLGPASVGARLDAPRPSVGGLALWLVLDAQPAQPVGLWRWGSDEAALAVTWDAGVVRVQTPNAALEAPWSPRLGEPTHLHLAWEGASFAVHADGFLLAQGELEDLPTPSPLWIGPWGALAGWPGRLDAVQQVAAPEVEPDGIGFVPRCDGQHDPAALWWPFDEGEGGQASPQGRPTPAFVLEGAAWTDALLGRYARDADRDAWGFEPEAVRACGKLNDDDVLRLGDCNDGNPSIYPTAPELPDLIDNDCDDDLDEATP
jgi:hypothetical protein